MTGATEHLWRVHRPNGVNAVIMVAPGGRRKDAYPMLVGRTGKRHRVTVEEALAVKAGTSNPLELTDQLETSVVPY